MTAQRGLALYDGTAIRAAAPVIRRYSSSFRLATSLFPRRCRADIASIYALVRIADELVDGTAAEAGLDPAGIAERLDELEAETARAIASGFSANLVVHAFALIANDCGIADELVRAFFSSMRRDLAPVDFDEPEYRRYIHGSAEVIGLMCLRVFLRGRHVPADDLPLLEEGARRLGAAFQKVNFLRDIGDDAARLGRSYLPGASPSRLTERDRAIAIDDIRGDLAAARVAIARLPRDCRRAVRVATGIFGELLARIERLPVERLAVVRVSVPASAKLAILLRCSILPGGGAA